MKGWPGPCLYVSLFEMKYTPKALRPKFYNLKIGPFSNLFWLSLGSMQGRSKANHYEVIMNSLQVTWLKGLCIFWYHMMKEMLFYTG